MAIQPLVTGDVFSNVRIFSWTGLASGDTGAPLKMPKFSDRTIHVFGTFGASGNGILEGSNDPRVETDPNNADWQPLTDPQGNALNTITAARLEQVMENPLYIRPRASGTGPSLTFILTVRK